MSVRTTQQIVQTGKTQENSNVQVTQQIVQYARDADVDPNFEITQQVVQVAKGFTSFEISVKSTSYPKLNPLSFFARSGSKSFIKGPNFVRVTQQIVQVAELRVPN